MIDLKVHHQDEITTIKTEGNDSLLQILRANGFELFAPCGGNGTCGKCKVWHKGEGSITACVHYVNESLEIILPDKKEANILVEQHKHTLSVPFNPGPSSGLSYLPHGVAIDLGTTSLVFYLVNLITGSIVETRAALNPQAQFGGDVISRISYASEKEGGLQELQKIILDAINEQLDHFAEFVQITVDEIVKITVSGNTTMLHLLLAVDPLSIALAPFTPKFIDEQKLVGKDLNLHCHTEGEIKIMPSISAYIGADIVSGMASIEPSEEGKNYLFMDLGTNGELALVKENEIICCATATGPAFEGANISCGMGALEGAISTYDQSGYTVIGDTLASGICGSGLIDIVAHLIGNNLVTSDGLLEKDFIVVPAHESENDKEVSITQQDIREVQLAKSAIASGVNILLKEAKLDYNEIDSVFLAGGFGNYINVESAMKIGLISSEFNDKIVPLGNTSGTGAVLALKSTQFDEVIADVLNRSRYIELSGYEDFALDFAMNMMFEPIDL
jgi:uncharacterized 2Fe-2S/4Fe-4S cluster protein (DUF4445 family)